MKVLLVLCSQIYIDFETIMNFKNDIMNTKLIVMWYKIWNLN